MKIIAWIFLIVSLLGMISYILDLIKSRQDILRNITSIITLGLIALLFIDDLFFTGTLLESIHVNDSLPAITLITFCLMGTTYIIYSFYFKIQRNKLQKKYIKFLDRKTIFMEEFKNAVEVEKEEDK